MKQIIKILLAIVVIGTLFSFDIPSKPNRLVNDYIDLLSSSEKDSLENRLLAFEKATSIQLTVVILDDLDGEEPSEAATQIGQNWGVGQKELDNGIVFLVVKYSQNALEKLFSSKRGDWFIAPGYGLEPYLTDYTAKSLGERYFIPYAKKDEVSKGIIATCDALIEHLGKIGWEQREELRTQQEAERREMINNFFSVLLGIFSLGGILFFFYWIIKKVKREYRKYLRKKEIRKNLKLLLEQKDAIIKETKISTSDFPDWALQEYKDMCTNINNIGNNMSNKITSSKNAKLNDLERIESEAKSSIKEIISLKRSIIDIPNTIQTYEQNAPRKLNDVQRLISSYIKEVDNKIEEGFLFQDFFNSLKGFKKEVENNKENLEKDSKLSKSVFLNLENIEKRVSDVKDLFSGILSAKKYVEESLESLPQEISDLKKRQNDAEKKLAELKSQNPRHIWEKFDEDFSTLSSLYTSINDAIFSARTNNTMDKQEFIFASSEIDKGKAIINQISVLFDGISEKKEKIETAKDQYSELLEDAEKKMKKNNLSSSKKRKVEKKIDEAKKKAETELVDWLVVIALLSSAINLAKKYKNSASSYSSRRRHRSNNSDDYSSGFGGGFGSSSGSSSGGGFGGFGGGNFGGGGAGGSW